MDFENITLLLKYLTENNIKLDLIEGKLHIKSTKGKVPSEIIDLIRVYKSELVENFRHYDSNEAHRLTKDRIDRVQRSPNKSYPASYAQNRYWLMEQLLDSNEFSPYNVPMSYNVIGRLNVENLIKAFHQLATSQEVFKTRLVFEAGNLVQRIDDESNATFDVVDVEPGNVKKAVENAESLRFNFDSDHLLKACLFRTREKESVLLIITHHSVFDGVSEKTLLSELLKFYNLLECPKELEPYELIGKDKENSGGVQYVDYAQWQIDFLKSEKVEALKLYWKNRLCHLPETPCFDWKEEAKLGGINQGRLLAVEISQQETLQLTELMRAENVSLFVVLLTALNVVLYKWTKRKDIVIGTVVAGREMSQLSDLIGCFVNFLPMRTKITGSHKLRELITQVKENTWNDLANQSLPFEAIIEQSKTEYRKNNNDQVFNVSLLVQNYENIPLQFGDLEIQPFHTDHKTALLDLRFIAQEIDEKIKIFCEYKKSLFEDVTVRALLDSLKSNLIDFITNLDVHVDGLSISDELSVRDDIIEDQIKTTVYI